MKKAPISLVLSAFLLSAATFPGVTAQIDAAIASSPVLEKQLMALEASGRFAGFTIGKPSGPFGASAEASKIVLTEEYLQALQQKRYFDVVYEDDILPDNTVFAIAHLAHHLAAPLSPMDFGTPMGFIDGMLNTEAKAYIAAWNVTMEGARKENKGKTLSNDQSGRFFMNLRYRLPFKDVQDFNDDGSIPASEANIQAIKAVLKDSPIADLQ